MITSNELEEIMEKGMLNHEPEANLRQILIIFGLR